VHEFNARIVVAKKVIVIIFFIFKLQTNLSKTNLLLMIAAKVKKVNLYMQNICYSLIFLEFIH